MMDVGRHPRIELLTYSEVDEVKGYIGNFKVRVRKKARYIDETECNACAECEKVCPVIVPDEFQVGLSSRRAVYLPFPQAVPSSYLIDMEACLGNNPIACGKCVEVCEKHCIDYDMEDKFVDLEIGTILVATGLEVYDPTEYDEYGYTRHPDVITSMEFERLICAGGPTEGHFVRPSDMERPKRIGFVQCVGSRSTDRGFPYCSNICCMNTVKDTLLLRDHYPDTECFVFYNDMRAFGKGFEDLYRRSREAGVRYVRGLPGELVPRNGELIATVENTETGAVETYPLDLIVLSVGFKPKKSTDPVTSLLTLSRTGDGFYMESHPKLKPVDAPTRGVYLVGTAESPKDVKDTVTQAGAAAARAGSILNSPKITVEAITSQIDTKKCTGCGICADVCPYHAIVVDRKKKTPAVVIEAACAGCGTCGAACPFGAITMRHFTDEQIKAQIDAILSENHMKKVVAFACNWCSYSGGDNAGIARLQYPPDVRLIRTMCSGRVSEDFVLHAFQQGAPVVLVSGCHFADCHYIDANRQTVKRVRRLWDKLERIGTRPERLQLEWISAAEGQKFAEVMTAMRKLRETVTEEEVAETVGKLTEEAERKAKRAAKSAKKEAVGA